MRFGRTGHGGWVPVPVPVLAAAAAALVGCSAGDLGRSGGDDGRIALTFLVDNSEATVKPAERLVADFNAASSDVEVTLETRPGGSEGDNVVKTRLSTGDMADVFMYNSGSLFQALNPQKNLVPLTGEPWMAKADATFRQAVTAGDEVYGAPFGTAAGGGVLYNRAIYDRLGLTPPKTWAEFMANNARIDDAGIAPVIQTYQDTWTSQLFVLGDFHNVLASEPDFAERYTANEAKYATSVSAVKGFEHLEAVHDAGYLNDDFASTKFEAGLAKLARGEGAHYPMLTFAIGPMVQTTPSAARDVGFFALPGDDAAEYGLTAWMPAGTYIPTTTRGDKLDAAKEFLAYLASPAGCDSQTKGTPPGGPYLLDGCELPADSPQAVKDLLAYFEPGGVKTLALEFLSPVKGPSLEQITVEVGSGIRSAKDGAALYDEDARKQAQQLGLDGW